MAIILRDRFKNKGRIFHICKSNYDLDGMPVEACSKCKQRRDYYFTECPNCGRIHGEFVYCFDCNANIIIDKCGRYLDFNVCDTCKKVLKEDEVQKLYEMFQEEAEHCKRLDVIADPLDAFSLNKYLVIRNADDIAKNEYMNSRMQNYAGWYLSRVLQPAPIYFQEDTVIELMKKEAAGIKEREEQCIAREKEQEQARAEAKK